MSKWRSYVLMIQIVWLKQPLLCLAKNIKERCYLGGNPKTAVLVIANFRYFAILLVYSSIISVFVVINRRLRFSRRAHALQGYARSTVQSGDYRFQDLEGNSFGHFYAMVRRPYPPRRAQDFQPFKTKVKGKNFLTETFSIPIFFYFFFFLSCLV